jgi:hypothetical protein
MVMLVGTCGAVGDDESRHSPAAKLLGAAALGMATFAPLFVGAASAGTA